MHNSLLISYLNYKTNSIFPQIQKKEPTGQQKLDSTVKKIRGINDTEILQKLAILPKG